MAEGDTTKNALDNFVLMIMSSVVGVIIGTIFGFIVAVFSNVVYGTITAFFVMIISSVVIFVSVYRNQKNE